MFLTRLGPDAVGIEINKPELEVWAKVQSEIGEHETTLGGVDTVRFKLEQGQTEIPAFLYFPEGPPADDGGEARQEEVGRLILAVGLFVATVPAEIWTPAESGGAKGYEFNFANIVGALMADPAAWDAMNAEIRADLGITEPARKAA